MRLFIISTALQGNPERSTCRFVFRTSSKLRILWWTLLMWNGTWQRRTHAFQVEILRFDVSTKPRKMQHNPPGKKRRAGSQNGGIFIHWMLGGGFERFFEHIFTLKLGRNDSHFDKLRENMFCKVWWGKTKIHQPSIECWLIPSWWPNSRHPF